VMPRQVPPVLYVIACGGRPAGQLPDFARFAQGQGWDVCVIATPDGTKFVDADELAELTGHPVRVQYKDPDEPDVLPPPDAFVIAPATFNTINKLAAGISDTLALGLINEAVGLGLPVIAAPWPSVQLYRHPVFQRSIAALRDWGVSIVINPERLPQASEGPPVFPWEELRAELVKLRTATRTATCRPGVSHVCGRDRSRWASGRLRWS
jgi:phosphopantothenoylcysteine synthetase/decarboxylase